MATHPRKPRHGQGAPGRVRRRWAGLDPSLELDGLKVRNPNHAVWDLAEQIADYPDDLLKPVVFCGPPGSGKTSLLHAIGNRAARRDPHLKIRYFTARSFLDRSRELREKGRASQWRRETLTLQLCLMDDLDAITGDEDAEESVFLTLDALARSGAAVVIACGKPALEITWRSPEARQFLLDTDLYYLP